METGEFLRVLLVINIVVMIGVALLYLRRRQMSAPEYFAWGLLAVCLPVLGAFLVIACRPGQLRSSQDTAQPQRQERTLAQTMAHWRQRATRQ